MTDTCSAPERAHPTTPTPSLAERRAAAARLLCATPARSDREIGRAVGLSAGTVSAVRRTLGERRAAQVRVGGDGRARPVSAVEGRRAAARLLAERPDIPVRAMARAAGISLGTAHDVRRRVLAGLPPVPEGRAATQSQSQLESQPRLQPESGSQPQPQRESRSQPQLESGSQSQRESRSQSQSQPQSGSQSQPQPASETAPSPVGAPPADPPPPIPLASRRALRHDPVAALDALRRDPTLRYSDTGRTILRRLDTQLLAADELVELCAQVPAHCGDQVEALLLHIGAVCLDAARAIHGRRLPAADEMAS